MLLNRTHAHCPRPHRAVPGAEAAAVVPLKVFEPVAIFAVAELPRTAVKEL
jgi:hypothetical protein